MNEDRDREGPETPDPEAATGKPRRPRRRGGSRRKKAGGIPGAPPEGAEPSPGAPGERPPGAWPAPWDAGAGEGPEAGPPATGEEGTEGGAPPPGPEAGEGVPGRGGRRKRRGRGRRGRARAPEAGGAPAAEGEPDRAAETAVPSEAPEAAGTAGEEPPAERGAGEPAGGGGKRRGRRRRRGRRTRRDEEGAALPAGEEATGAEGELPPPRDETEEEVPLGIAATGAAIVPAPAPESYAEEPEEEEEEAGGEPGRKGPRRVMLIDGMNPEEIRVAFVIDTVLDYFEIENQRKKLFKGNIYKGKVVNVAPAIEAAFVEFGGGRHGFLPLNEYCGGALIDKLDDWDETEKRPPLRPGTEILVQVTKEESSVKGAALTSYISIAGRYLVMMLGMKRYGISKKITSEKEREKIRKNMEKLDYPEHLGFIVRTVGAGRPQKDLRADLENLLKLWRRIVGEARDKKAPSLLYEEQDIVIRTLRDNYDSDVTEVLMDSPDSHRKALDFFSVYYPEQKGKLKRYAQKRPLFSKFNLDEQIERATGRKVPLPSGGHIVIDRTEAVWTVDVNSGRSSKDRDIEDTAFRTNKEAAVETARQMRIRDMGGLLVIDFIDMEERRHVKEVERILKEEMKRDKAKSDISAMGKFGLVALTRQRMGISFYDVQYRDCDVCGGTRFVPTADAVMVRLLRRIHDELSRDPGKETVVRVPPHLLETLLNDKRDEISRLERLCGARVVFVADPGLPAASFSVGGGET